MYERPNCRLFAMATGSIEKAESVFKVANVRAKATFTGEAFSVSLQYTQKSSADNHLDY